MVVTFLDAKTFLKDTAELFSLFFVPRLSSWYLLLLHSFGFKLLLHSTTSTVLLLLLGGFVLVWHAAAGSSIFE